MDPIVFKARETIYFRGGEIGYYATDDEGGFICGYWVDQLIGTHPRKIKLSYDPESPLKVVLMRPSFSMDWKVELKVGSRVIHDYASIDCSLGKRINEEWFDFNLHVGDTVGIRLQRCD